MTKNVFLAYEKGNVNLDLMNENQKSSESVFIGLWVNMFIMKVVSHFYGIIFMV